MTTASACCVSATQTGKEIQFFGARANLAKCLLYAINGGVDEKTKVQVAPAYRPITSEYLDYDEVMEKYDEMMEWLSKLYVDTLNMIHYMHDKYYYEASRDGSYRYRCKTYICNRYRRILTCSRLLKRNQICESKSNS